MRFAGAAGLSPDGVASTAIVAGYAWTTRMPALMVDCSRIEDDRNELGELETLLCHGALCGYLSD